MDRHNGFTWLAMLTNSQFINVSVKAQNRYFRYDILYIFFFIYGTVQGPFPDK